LTLVFCRFIVFIFSQRFSEVPSADIQGRAKRGQPMGRKGAGHNFASQNYCSPMHPGWSRFCEAKSLPAHAAWIVAGLEQWNARSVPHPGFLRRFTPQKMRYA
jgi:hypothetical protein